MRTGRLGSAATLLVLALTPFARAEVAWLTADEGLKKRGSASSFVVLLGKPEGDLSKKLAEHLEARPLAKLVKDLATVRVDPTDEEAKKLGLDATKGELFLVQDGYGITIEKSEKPPTADTLARLLRSAQEQTARKKKLEKKAEGAVAAAEAAIKRNEPKAACEQLLGVVALKEQIPCPAVETAEKRLEELKGKADTILEKAREAQRKQDYSQAQRLIAEAGNDYPIPAVQEEVKKAKGDLAQEINSKNQR